VYFPEREVVFGWAGRNSANKISTLLGQCLLFQPISKGNAGEEREQVSILRLPSQGSQGLQLQQFITIFTDVWKVYKDFGDIQVKMLCPRHRHGWYPCTACSYPMVSKEPFKKGIGSGCLLTHPAHEGS